MAYSESERLVAVEIVRRNDGRIDAATLSEVQAAVGKPVTAPSIRGWIEREKNIPENLREEKNKFFLEPVEEVVRRKLDEKLEDAAHKFVDRATDQEAIDEMKPKDAMLAAAIAIDKMQLLRGLPTEVISMLPVVIRIHEFLSVEGADSLQTLQRFYDGLVMAKAKQHARLTAGEVQ